MHVLLIVGVAVSVYAVSPQSRTVRREVCRDSIEAVIDQLGGPGNLRDQQVRRQLDRAVVAFRFNKRSEAVAKLGAVGALLRDASQRLSDKRQDITSAVSALSRCFAANQPAALATLTITAYRVNPDAPDDRGPIAAGAYLTIEDVDVGRTGADGTLTLQVPSGPIRIEAFVPPSEWGEAQKDLDEGVRDSASIVLADGKEVGLEVDVSIVEAVRDVIPAKVKSFTMRLTRDGVAVGLKGIDRIYLLDRNYNTDLELEDFFTLDSNMIVARDPGALLAKLGGRTEIVMAVEAFDSLSDFTYVGMIEFRLQ